MKRIVIRKPGGYERLSIEDAPDLVPRPGHVVVDVEAAGVNYADCVARMGYYSSANKLVGFRMPDVVARLLKGLSLPPAMLGVPFGKCFTPGFEFAGRISGVGAGVRSFSCGQEVFGVNLFNCYASQVSVPEHQVFSIPPQLTMKQAATFPVVFLTAWYAAVKLAQLSRGVNVLIHSAAGGVGSALTQIVSSLACDVVGVVGSTFKVEVARRMGCSAVIDKNTESLWPTAERYSPSGYGVVFDATGVSTLAGSYEHLAPTGRLVIYGFHSMLPRTGGRPNPMKLIYNYLRTPRFHPMRMTVSNKSVMAFNLSFLFGQKHLLEDGMRNLLSWLEEGRVHSLPVEEYRLSDVALAHQALESGKTTGKLMLIP